MVSSGSVLKALFPDIQTEGYRVSRKKIKILKAIYIVIVAISALIVAGYCFVTYGIRPPSVDRPATPSPSSGGNTGPLSTEGPGETDAPIESPKPVQREEVYTCLLFGMDDGNGCTDTIMVATFDVPNKKIGLVSIPRDTVVRLDKDPGWNKVNTAYAAGGVEQLRDELEELLGIPINFYIQIQLNAFKELVDAVGGVWFEVPFDMKYIDETQNLFIDQPAGYRLLSGDDAMQVVRFRQSNTDSSFSDVGRVGVQQAFLKAMISQVMSGVTLSNIPDLVNTVFTHVKTDASINDALYFGRAMVGVDVGSAITTATLPAVWHYPYMWVDDEEKALETINTLLNPYDVPVTIDMVEFLQQ